MQFLKKYYKSTTLILFGVLLSCLSDLQETTTGQFSNLICETKTIMEQRISSVFNQHLIPNPQIPEPEVRPGDVQDCESIS